MIEPFAVTHLLHWYCSEGDWGHQRQDLAQYNFENRKDSFPELMQFTGLLDKNGKEIYEGDIIQHYQNKRDGKYKYGHPHKVEFVNTTNKAGWNITKSSIKEVIGNIYENPELLQSEPKASAA